MNFYCLGSGRGRSSHGAGWGIVGTGLGRGYNYCCSLMMHHNGRSSMMHWHQRHNRLHGMHSHHGLGDDRMHDLHSGGMMHHMAAKDRERETKKRVKWWKGSIDL